MNDPRELERSARTIGPGAWAVESGRPIATLLGSCVAVCLWDPALHLGGMNHFMLPYSGRQHTRPDIDTLLCGDFAMEALLNGMIARGARRARLQAKAFGGGAVVPGLTHSRIGQQNVEFARQWLQREHIPLVASDFLGRWSRKVILEPSTGDAYCKRGEEISSGLISAEERYEQALAKPRKTDIELF
ncbi:MAG TPA: chemotaxis protein CheD [Aromatoleum sp.]|uniref:chemotaxis protein CheD n=1 Tax=Aromatoleum sp. TaxID=2307007 RepID=UPI002B4859E6|nr:chemotaxis protein CheD [Aromatoleum sp.]HJV26256.1 chemotaxis protein CheD [Aromatoleum sp.]